MIPLNFRIALQSWKNIYPIRPIHIYSKCYCLTRKVSTPQVGLEPTTSGLEVRRAIHCATEAC